jgi:predicted phage terminase large subunit-like protein
MAKNFAEQIPGLEVHIQKREYDFTRIGGGWIQFRTAEEPDALRGEGIDFAVFDEAAHIVGLEELWEQCVRPSLMDRMGEAWFVTTPKGFNYFNTLYKRAEESSEWSSFQYSTEANPKIKRSEIDELRATLPVLVARQEIDAEFVQLAGALFKRQNISVVDFEPNDVKGWVRSWDLAFTEKTTSDFTAGAKMGMRNNGGIVISDLVHGRYEWPDALRTIASTAKMDGPAVRQGVEVVGAQVGALQSLVRDPLLVEYTIVPIQVHKDKLTRALPLVARSEQGKLEVVRGNWNGKLLDEFCSFPEGMHDDTVDACSGGMTLLGSGYGQVEVESFDKDARKEWGYDGIQRRRTVLI